MRACATSFFPAENKTNVEEDLTPEQLENLNVHYVKTIDEALGLALPASTADCEGRA